MRQQCAISAIFRTAVEWVFLRIHHGSVMRSDIDASSIVTASPFHAFYTEVPLGATSFSSIRPSELGVGSMKDDRGNKSEIKQQN